MVKSCVYREVSALWRILEPEICAHVFYPHSPAPLPGSPPGFALGTLSLFWICRANFIHKLHRNLFWLFHCFPLWVEENQSQDTNESSRIGLTALRRVFLQRARRPAPLSSPSFIMTLGVRLSDRNWFWPDLQDLGQHAFLGGVHGLSFCFNFPEKKNFKDLRLI